MIKTLRQKRLAINIADPEVRKRFNSLRDLLVYSGYAIGSAAANPGAIIAQKGVQEYLKELGFTEGIAKASIGEILLNGKEENRIKAAQEVFKIFGTYAPEKTESTSLIGIILKEIQNDGETDIFKEQKNNRERSTNETNRIDGNRSASDRDKEEVKRSTLEIKQSVLD